MLAREGIPIIDPKIDLLSFGVANSDRIVPSLLSEKMFSSTKENLVAQIRETYHDGYLNLKCMPNLISKCNAI